MRRNDPELESFLWANVINVSNKRTKHLPKEQDDHKGVFDWQIETHFGVFVCFLGDLTDSLNDSLN